MPRGGLLLVGALGSAVLLLRARARRRARRRVHLQSMSPADIPAQLRVAHYVDLAAARERGYAHADYLEAARTWVDAIVGLKAYTTDAAIAQIRAAALRPSTLTCALGDPPSATASDAALGAGTHRVCAPWPPSIGRGVVLLDADVGVFAAERLIGKREDDHASADADAPAEGRTVYVGRGAQVFGGVLDVSAGPIVIGEGAKSESSLNEDMRMRICHPLHSPRNHPPH